MKPVSSQGALMLREITRFQEENQVQQWPIILAGGECTIQTRRVIQPHAAPHRPDFNSAPSDPLYALLVGEPLSPQQVANIDISTLVHTSIDPSVPITVGSIRPSGAALKKMKRQAMNPSAYPPPGPQPQAPVIDPSEELVNARAAIPEDGLLSVEELSALFPGHLSSSSSGVPFTSVYDSAFQTLLAQDTALHPDVRGKNGLNVFGNRPRGDNNENYDSWDKSRKGANEPMYTNYTRKWHFTVVRLFIFLHQSSQSGHCSLLLPWTLMYFWMYRTISSSATHSRHQLLARRTSLPYFVRLKFNILRLVCRRRGSRRPTMFHLWQRLTSRAPERYQGR